MTKFFISILVMFSIHMGYSQTSNAPKFFAQCLLDLSSPEQAQEITLSLKENPYVDIVRIDWPTKRIFLTTKNITVFSEADFNSWLGEFSSLSHCTQVGLHGTDQVNPYPVTNCNE